MSAHVAAQPTHSISDGTRPWNELVAGYSLVAVGLLIDLPIIGSSSAPAMVSVAIAAVIAVGILLSATGMLGLRAGVVHARKGARLGLGAQSVGLIVLLIGVVALQISTLMPFLLVSASLVAGAAVIALAGGVLLRRHHVDIGVQSRIHFDFLLFGTSLIFIGVAVILASNVGYYYVFSDPASTVVSDVGAAISAFGCVIAAYASFVMRSRAGGIHTHNGAPG